MDNIMFGRIEFTIAYNNIIKILNSILTTEELEEFETSCNLIYDSLQYGISNEEDEIIPIQDFSDDNLYSIFRQEINKVFDNILLKFGIKSNIISINADMQQHMSDLSNVVTVDLTAAITALSEKLDKVAEAQLKAAEKNGDAADKQVDAGNAQLAAANTPQRLLIDIVNGTATVEVGG